MIPIVVFQYDCLISRRSRRRRDMAAPAGSTVRDLLLTLERDPEQTVVVRNGKGLTKREDLDALIAADDVFDIAPMAHDPVSTIIAVVIAVASAVASALLISSIKLPDGDRERERRFAFDRFSSDAVVGDPIPVCLGHRTRHGGRVVSDVPVESVDGSSKARILINLGRGRINTIGDQTDDFDDLAPGDGGILGVYINDQAAENFDGVRVWGRMGTAGQAIIPGFDDTEILQDVGPDGGALLANTSGMERTGADASAEAFEFTTSGGVDAVIIRIHFPQGLYTAASSGRPLFRSASFRFRWRVNDVGGGDSGEWSAWQVSTVTRDEASAFTVARRIDGLDDSDGPLDIQVERVSVEPSSLADRDEMRWISLIEVDYTSNNFEYEDGLGGYAMLAVEITANEQLSGQTPRISVEVDGVRVRVKKADAEPDDVDPWESDFEYSANPAALALALIENASWGMGARFGVDDVDLVSLFEWWDWCDEEVERFDGSMETRPRFACHMTLRDAEDGWEQLIKICRAGRAIPQRVGNVIRFVMDRAQDVPIEVFTEGSLAVEDEQSDSGLTLPGPRYRREWTTGGKAAPNRLVCVFENANDRGEQDTLAWPEIGEEWLATEPVREEHVRLEGVTDPDQAMAELIHQMKRRRLESMSIEFETSHEVVRVQPGERFDVAWSVPGWGVVSGRIKQGSTDDTILIDEPFEMAMGVDYNFTIVYADGTRETIAIDSVEAGPGHATQINLDGALTATPDPFAEYAIEIDGAGLKPFICESIDPVDVKRRIWKIRGREYVAAAHLDTPGAEIVIPPYPTLYGPGIPPGPVIGLTATVELIGGRSVVRLSWRQQPIDAAHTASFSIYRRQTGTPFSIQPARTVATTTVVLDLIDGLMEEFTVVAVAPDGAQLSPNAAPVTEIVDPPTDPTAPEVEFLDPPDPATSATLSEEDDDTISLAWDPSPDAAEYRIEVGHTLDSTGTTFPGIGQHGYGAVLQRVPAPATQFTGVTLPAGFQAALGVRAVNSQGRVSRIMAVDTITPAAPSGESLIASQNFAINTESAHINGGWVNLDYDATQQRLRLIDPTTGGQWTSDRVSLGSSAVAARLRWLCGAALDIELDAEVGALDWEIPSILSDLITMAGTVDPTAPRLAIPPLPDAAVSFEVQVAWTTEAGDVGWGPFTAVPLVGELQVTARQVQWRVVLTRTVFPYLPALGDFYFAATG